jgi:uroporphyrinogen-III decarboxylase
MKSISNSLERVETVLRGDIPDRVPVDLHNFLMVAQESRLPFPEFMQSGEAMAEGHIKAWREYGHDLLILENGTVALAQACGCQVEYIAGSAPVHIGPAINSLDEIDKLVIYDPYKAHPLIENLKATSIVSKEIGDKAFIVLALGTPALVTEKVREELGVFAPGGGLILGPGRALPSITPPENIHILIETTHRYGRYTSDGQLAEID